MSDKPLRIAVLSDTHFRTDTSGRDSFFWNTVRCTQSLPQLPTLVEKLKALDLDLILHLGDFTNDGSIESYEAGMTGLTRVGVPIHVVRGNHDTGSVADLLVDGNGRTFVMNHIRFILLDSCVRETEINPLAHNKRCLIQPPQLQWLEQVLTADPENTTVIASHFPIKTGAFYPTTVDPDQNKVNGLSADAIHQRIGYLGNRDEVWSLIRRFPNVRLCLAGHWHINEIDVVDQITCMITASICEFPCQFRLLTIAEDTLTIETLASGIDPLSSYVAKNKNDFPLGKPDDRARIIPLSNFHYNK